MELYLVRGRVEETRYMNDRVAKTEDMRLVRAESEYDAIDKWCAFWKKKTVEYSIYYTAFPYEAAGVIE